MITNMMTKKARIGQRLALLTRVFAALAAGTLLFSTLTGCEQTTSSTTRKGQLTVNGAPEGVVYVASIYKPMEGLTEIKQADWDTDLWAKATDSKLLAARGMVAAGGDPAVIPLNTPDGGDFTGDRTFLAVITPATPYDPPQQKHYSITDFTAGRAAVNWSKLDSHTSEVYTITFHTDGSSFYSEVPYKGKVVKPELAQMGDALDGWYTDAGCTETYDFSKSVAGNLDLYARWLPSDSRRTVTFYMNDGTDDEYITQQIANGKTATRPANPKRQEWAFLGWYTQKSGGIEYAFAVPVTDDLMLYAQWTQDYCTVTFDLNGADGTPPPQENIPRGKTATRPADPKREGWEFNGWFADAAGTGEAWDFSKSVTSNLELYAKWTEKRYTVTFDLNYQGAPEAPAPLETIPHGSTAKRPADPKREYYIFGGWYEDKDCKTTPWAFSTPVTRDLDLYAKWTKKRYTVTFYLNYGSNDVHAVQSVEHNGTAQPEVPTRTGYTIDGWYTQANGGTKYNFNTPVTRDLYLYAQWTRTYTVTFNLNGAPGTAPTQAVPQGDTVTEPSNPTWEGGTFGGWYKDKNCALPWSFDTAVTGNITLYAKWTKHVYTVMFDLNEAPGTAPTHPAVPYGGTITKPSDQTRTGYTFGGWYTEANGGTIYDFKTLVTGNITLYAKWTKLTYNVTFALNGAPGTAPTQAEVPHGGTISKPTPDPTRTGYTFGGWYTEANGGTIYDFKTLVTGNLTLYAQWNINTYTVTFDLNGAPGTVPVHPAVQHGDTITKPSDPTRTGYTFGGWYKDKTCTLPWSFDTAVTGNIKLYAKWTTLTYTVTFDLNGAPGTAPTHSAVPYGGTIIKPSDLTRTGYTFGGWYQNAAGTGAAWNFDTDAVNKDIKLYAKWTKLTYIVTFNTGGVLPTPAQLSAVPYDEKIPEPDITKPGHTLNGWYKEAAKTTLWNFATDTVTKNLTLYAQWNINTYNVTFNLNGAPGTVPTHPAVQHGGTITEPPAPQWAGWTVDGWYRNPAGTGTAWNFGTHPVTEPITLYAKWAVWLLSKETEWYVLPGQDPTLSYEETTVYTAYTDETHYTYRKYPNGATPHSREYSRNGDDAQDDDYYYVFDPDSGLVKEQTPKTATSGSTLSYGIILQASPDPDVAGATTYKYYNLNNAAGPYRLFTIKDGVILKMSAYHGTGPLISTETYTFPNNDVIRKRLPKLTLLEITSPGIPSLGIPSDYTYETCELQTGSTDTTMTVRIKTFKTLTNVLSAQYDYTYTKRTLSPLP